MKITHIIIGLSIGGAELMLKRLVLGLNKKDGIEHIVISLGSLGDIGKELQEKGVSVYYLKMTSFLKIPITFFKLRSLLKSIQPDLVQTWMYHSDFIGGLVCRTLGIKKLIWSVRTTDVTLGPSKVTVKLRSLCAKLSKTLPCKIIYAAHASRIIHEGLGYSSNKSLVLPNGFDLDQLIVDKNEVMQLKKDFNISEKDFVIGTVGRFNKVKNQIEFIKMAEIISQQIPEAKFVMIGRGNNWENPQLEQWINEVGLRDRFLLLGERRDVVHCLNIFDVFTLHSRTEGFPNVLGEAMSQGLLIATYDVGDAAHLLGECGIVSSTNSPQDLAQAILKLQQLPVKEVQILTENAVKRIHENFALNMILKKYHELYIQLLHE